MMQEHTISEAVMKSLRAHIDRNRCWMAYNTMSYFLETGDVYLFKHKDEADEFASNNISDRDCFNVINVSSFKDALQQILYGRAAGDYLDPNEENDLQQLLSKYLITNKNSVMNEKNYEYLTEQLKRTGFEDTLNEVLRKNMEKQVPEFTLYMQKDYGTDNVKASLHFKKSDESEMFFFNRYDLQLKKEENEEAIKQTFYPDKKITLKEGYNLLDGRAVHKTLTTKEDQKYAAWLQLDFTKNTESGNYQFKQYHQNYGYDLEKVLSKYPIKELSNEKFKEALIKSLERGNLQSATFLLAEKEQKIFLTPNLAFKTLNAFNDNMQKISLSELMQKNKQEQTNKVDNKQNISEKKIVKNDNKLKNEENSPVRKPRKKQKITQ
jgi:hypothetical protein